MTRSRLAVASLSLLLHACGGRSPVGPGPVPTPSPTPPAELHAVGVVVFYDENRNGVLDATERVRVPNVTVAIAGRTGQTEKATGRAVVSAPAGPQSVAVQRTPPFFVPGPPVSITVPTSSDILVPLTLPIGGNRPNTYMAFGDSITVGDGSSDGLGYRGFLKSRLEEHLGRATVINAGAGATRSTEGVERIGRNLRLHRPAHALILYGTNDWNECMGEVPCVTIDSLRQIVATTKAARTLPVLATIIPANPDRTPPERNEWVAKIDDLIRSLAQEEGAVLADLESVFRREGDLTQLFSDHVHPNNRGYRIIADELFRALTEPSASTAAWDPADSFDLPPWPEEPILHDIAPVRGPQPKAYDRAGR